MYNEKLKQEYIYESETRNAAISTLAPTIFKKVEEYENKLNKDASQFSAEEILNMYKSLCCPSLESLMNFNSALKVYTDYCVNKNLVADHQNHYVELSNVDILVTCVNKGLQQARIVTRDELLKEIENIINPSEQFLILALFEGICGKEMIELSSLTMNDFNGNKVNLVTGRELEVSDKLIEFAKKSAEEYTYYPYKQDGSASNRDDLSFEKTDEHILKRMPNGREDSAQIYINRRLINKMQRLTECLGTPIFNRKSLQVSGRIEMAKTIAKENNISFEKALVSPDVTYRYGKVSSIRRFMVAYGDCIEEK